VSLFYYIKTQNRMTFVLKESEKWDPRWFTEYGKVAALISKSFFGV